jgi:hypothetical protein
VTIVKRGGSYGNYRDANNHIKFNNSGMAEVKIVKNERDPPLFTSKQLIKF